ncbi:MAG: GerAB/ArcD/ProY family transporter, partial [Pseudomonadota bacterium]
LAYMLWAIWLSALYTRYYAERLTSSIYTTVSNNIIILFTLIPIAYMLRSGFTVIARMSEVLLPFIGGMLVLLSVFLLPSIRTDNVLPVSISDVIPMFKASLSTTSILAYLFLLFFLSDKIVNMKSLKTFGYIATYINISSVVLVNFITIGVLGYSVTQRAPLPVLITVKQVSLLDTIENIEAIIIAIWIFADFTLISTMLVVALNLLKSLFRLSDTKPLINILVILVYFLSLGISSDKFELEEFSNVLLIPINITLGYVFPLILFLTNVVKQKYKKTTAQKN